MFLGIKIFSRLQGHCKCSKIVEVLVNPRKGEETEVNDSVHANLRDCYIY
jgi:hypothetical protein